MMKVIIAGDFAPTARLAKLVEERNFGEIFSENLRKIIKSADFSFVNFESPIVENGYNPIQKCGPNLRCTKEAAEAVKYAGFTGVTMANNHILDYGAEGLRKTVECCESQGLDIVGVGNNLKEAERVLYLSKGNKVLAVINCCEHEFSIATDKDAGANPLNPIRQFYLIQEAKKQADYVLVIVHGGHEYYQLPSSRMQETYRFFIDTGADAVVNHHQHCYSGYEIYNGKPIFYGLGNFCFDNNEIINTSWNEGFFVQISFGNDIEYELYPYCQFGTNPTISLTQNDVFESEIKRLNDVIADEHKILSEETDYYLTNYKRQIFMFEPYQNKILDKLFDMKILPSTITKKKLLRILNYIICESHRDKLINAIKKIIKEEYE